MVLRGPLMYDTFLHLRKLTHHFPEANIQHISTLREMLSKTDQRYGDTFESAAVKQKTNFNCFFETAD